jgi:hypothetical protein
MQGTYEYKDGETLLVMIHDGLDVESTLREIKDVLKLTALSEVDQLVNQDNTYIFLRR